MRLKQGEMILVWRKRRGLDYSTLGKLLWPDMAAPHVKLKKLERGLQKPTPMELKKIAEALDVSAETLTLDTEEEGVAFNDEALGMFPNLAEYVSIINAAARLGDKSIIKKIMPEIQKMFS